MVTQIYNNNDVTSSLGLYNIQKRQERFPILYKIEYLIS